MLCLVLFTYHWHIKRALIFSAKQVLNLYHCEIGGQAGLSSKRHIETNLDLQRVTVSNQF